MSREMYESMIEKVDREIEKLAKQKQMLQNALMLESGGAVEIAMITASGKGFMEMARDVLASKKLNPSQEVQHTKRIGELIHTEFKVPVDFKSLSQMLHANTHKAKTKYFYKDRKLKNTYGLVEWQK